MEEKKGGGSGDRRGCYRRPGWFTTGTGDTRGGRRRPIRRSGRKSSLRREGLARVAGRPSLCIQLHPSPPCTLRLPFAALPSLPGPLIIMQLWQLRELRRGGRGWLDLEGRPRCRREGGGLTAGGTVISTPGHVLTVHKAVGPCCLLRLGELLIIHERAAPSPRSADALYLPAGLTVGASSPKEMFYLVRWDKNWTLLHNALNSGLHDKESGCQQD